MARLMSAWSNIVRRNETDRVRQADGHETNYRVLTTSLLLAVVVAALLYFGWYMYAAPQVSP